MGFTLNTMTMLALTLSVGIVIDDAIVVLENIYRFIEEKHDDRCRRRSTATQEIGLAVLATTLSLVAVFVPVGFMGGIVGRFMKSFGLTMAFAIMVSLLVSFTLTPMLSARWLKVDEARQGQALVEGLDGLPRRSTRSTRACSSGRWPTAGSWPASRCWCCCRACRCSWSPTRTSCRTTTSREFEVNMRAPEGTSLEATEVIANRIATAVRARLPEVRLHAGDDRRRPGRRRATWRRSTCGSKPIEARTRDQFAIMDERPQATILPPLRRKDLRTSVQPVADDRRRRRAERRHPVHHQRART